jgi:Kef-type K+ transport system membrane component KefB
MNEISASELTLLIQAIVILVLPVALWRLFWLRNAMPLVCVQIIVGIALGPSLLGRIAPDLYQLTFSPATLKPLSGLSCIAVLLFGYVTGLHLRLDAIQNRGRTFAFVSSASIVVPMIGGFLAGLWIVTLNPAELINGVGPITFAFAISICVSVTALPVLGAILREMDLLGEWIGDYALAIAAVNDAVLWILLGGLMAALGGSASGQYGWILSLCGTPLYILIMFRYVRPYLRRIIPHLRKQNRISDRALAAVCGIAICSAIITELLGLHYVFGAFIAGVIMPNELRQLLLDRLQLVVIGILMPFFFMITGLRTFIDLTSIGFVEILLVTTAIGLLGKVGGTMLAMRLTGEPWRYAFTIGALVQAKGLMELVVLTILFDMKIISANAFSALTLMAVLTTLLTMPLTRIGLRFVERHRTASSVMPSTVSMTAPK